MRLTLHVPGLLLPREILADTVFDLAAPSLSLLLGRGRRQALAADWLPAAFGLAGLPVAALRQAAGGMADGDWLCLDPVHFDVRREGILLADPARLALTPDEDATLRAALQPLFAEWGELCTSAPGCWELRLARPLALATMPLPESVGRPVDPALPGGSDGRECRRLLAEAQTVLHAHPANRQREAAGRPTVSSLWPWGAGSAPVRSRSDFDAVWSDDPALAGLCTLAGVSRRPMPARFEPASGRVLAIDASLERPARDFDALCWREALLALERDWLAPTMEALRRGRCETLTLVGTQIHGAPAVMALTADRAALRRFWRRPQPLSILAEIA